MPLEEDRKRAVKQGRAHWRKHGLCHRCGAVSEGLSRCAACRALECAERANNRAADVSARPTKACPQCGRPVAVYNQHGGKPKVFCSVACLVTARGVKRRCISAARRAAVPPKEIIQRFCSECSAPSDKCVTCSAKCRYVRLRRLLNGKKYQDRSVHEFTCVRCSGRYDAQAVMKEKVCKRCRKKAQRKRSGHKHAERARRFGVPYTYGIGPKRVFQRDGWRCQLCGCSTPARLRGTDHPRSPELDHIVPLSKGGPHTWDNVQCACKSCNSQKSAKVLGQFRIPFCSIHTPHQGVSKGSRNSLQRNARPS